MTTRPHPESERPLRGPLQSFDLDTEVTRLREEKAWQEGRRNAITLRKGEGLNVVLLVMKEGDRLDEHSAPGPITLSVHEGRIRFSAANEEVEAEAGTLLEKLANGPTRSYAGAKQMLNRRLYADLAGQLDAEAEAQKGQGQSKDFIEGVKAFFEKREPNFTGT